MAGRVVSVKGCEPDGRVELLVVDDERSIAESLQSFLEGVGYRVLTAGDGSEALAEIERSARTQFYPEPVALFTGICLAAGPLACAGAPAVPLTP